VIDNKTASHIAGLARFAAMDAMYKQAQQPVAPGSSGKSWDDIQVSPRAATYWDRPEPLQPGMKNPTPTGDLPNFYDQEMYELNRPENQATFPSYRSGSALKPEIQAGFPEEWFGSPGFHGVGDPRWRSRMQGPPVPPVDEVPPPDPGWMGGMPERLPDDYINPGKRERDPSEDIKDLLPGLGGGLKPPIKSPLRQLTNRGGSPGGGGQVPQTHDRTGRLLDEPTHDDAGQLIDDPR
jgi:hypothetical protein